MATAHALELEPVPMVCAPPGKANVVIIGAGFGGLEAAKKLARQNDVYVTLIDRRNYHLFQPLLYQVATAGLDASSIAVPIRAQFKRAPNVEVHLAHVDMIDVRAQVVHTESLRIGFEYLIVATGSTHAYFGHKEWEPYAPGLKTVEQAIELRRRIYDAFERAENQLTDEEMRTRYMTFVIVGAGPTGVELAGAIADIRRTVLKGDFRHIDPTHARVLLIEAGPRILQQFAEDLATMALKDLHELGVEVMTSNKVEQVDAEGVVANGRRIWAKTVVWAAGVRSSPLGRQLGAPVDRSGRVTVTKDLSIPDHPNVFVIGDLAHVVLPSGDLAPGLAPVAMQQGRLAASNILATVRGRERKPFCYHDKGMLATIGKHKAILQTRRIHMDGYFAWVAWLFVHIFYLVGFRNRIQVFLRWVWSYLFSKRGSRLITSNDWRLEA